MLLTDAETASERITAAASSIESFVADVFDRSYLLVVENGMRLTPDLALATIQRTVDGIHSEIPVDHPGYDVSDDHSEHSLLLAIDDEVGGVPETATIDIQGHV